LQPSNNFKGGRERGGEGGGAGVDERRVMVDDEKKKKGVLFQMQENYKFVFSKVVISALCFIFSTCHTSMMVNGANGANLNGAEMDSIKQPSGFEIKKHEMKVYKLRKALYGLKQAPRAWNLKIDSFLSHIGFDKCICEHGMYVKSSSEKGDLLVCLYVDELLVTGSNESLTTSFKSSMLIEFEMTDLGELSYFLGIEFK
jgi:hypothetical protein